MSAVQPSPTQRSRPRRAWLRPQWLRRLGQSALIGGQAVASIARGRIGFNDLMTEMMEAGPGSLLIVLITGVAAGTVFNIQVAAELTNQGAGSTVGGILAVGLAREIAPILTATLVTGKVATAYARCATRCRTRTTSRRPTGDHLYIQPQVPQVAHGVFGG